MRLIADSGSTCTDWHLITSKGQVEEYTTIGLNPYFVPTAEMVTAVDGELSAKLDLAKVDEVFFYGAGCSSEEKCVQVNEALASVFANAKIEVNHDLMGAARAALCNSSGIVAILGTGVVKAEEKKLKREKNFLDGIYEQMSPHNERTPEQKEEMARAGEKLNAITDRLYDIEKDLINQARVMEAHRISSEEKRFVPLDEIV